MPALVFVSEETPVHQRDQYAQVSVQCYRIDARSSDQELLTALVQAPSYASDSLSYAVGSRGAHGPFLQVELSADAFEPCLASDAIATLERWVTDGARPPTPDETSALATRVVSLLRGNLYRLPEDLSGSLSIGATWLEYVAIDRESERLALVVAWDD